VYWQSVEDKCPQLTPLALDLLAAPSSEAYILHKRIFLSAEIGQLGNITECSRVWSTECF